MLVKNSTGHMALSFHMFCQTGRGGDTQQMFSLGGCLILIIEGQMIISIIQLKTRNVAFL